MLASGAYELRDYQAEDFEQPRIPPLRTVGDDLQDRVMGADAREWNAKYRDFFEKGASGRIAFCLDVYDFGGLGPLA